MCGSGHTEETDPTSAVVRIMQREKETLKRKYIVWTPEATRCFVRVWEENLASFRGHRKKTLIHKDMAEAMASDFDVTRSEIKAKLQVMTKRYHKEASQFAITKTKPTWEYFHTLRNMFEGDYDDFGELLGEAQNDEHLGESLASDDETAEGSSASEFEFPEAKLFRSDKETKLKSRRAGARRRLAIDVEEDKLAVQKETLSVMRSMATDLSNMYSAFLRVYKEKNVDNSI